MKSDVFLWTMEHFSLNISRKWEWFIARKSAM
jgi:hypothetical protein